MNWQIVAVISFFVGIVFCIYMFATYKVILSKSIRVNFSLEESGKLNNSLDNQSEKI